jgi:hypothetical protein|tara:strand:+ start:17190 stop:17366 length:177 start_codon:yes stop_codon:yes gene_type:complete
MNIQFRADGLRQSYARTVKSLSLVYAPHQRKSELRLTETLVRVEAGLRPIPLYMMKGS